MTNGFKKNDEDLVDLADISDKPNNKLDEYSDEIKSLKNELNSIKEVNDKTKDLLLLEMESNLDKQKIELDKYQKGLDEKNDLIEKLAAKNEELNKDISNKNDTIESLENEVSRLKHDEGDKFEYLNDELISLRNSVSVMDTTIENLNNELAFSRDSISSKNAVIDGLNSKLQDANKEINSLKKKGSSNNGKLEKKLKIANAKLKKNIEQIKYKDNQIKNKDNQIKNKDNQILAKEKMLNSLKKQNNNQISKLDNKEYCISCFKEEIENNHLEIQYLKKDTLTRKLCSPLAYVYLLFKSNPKELSLNYKLYKALKNSKCFDIGYYLSHNEDLCESKWSKFLSLELHYVCNGFNEKRKFNKKYFNRNSKKELLDYIMKCP